MGLISIIVPVAPRANRQVLHTRQLETLASKVSGHDFEFIFVDHGSHQESLSILEECAAKDKRYRIITLTRDFGPTASFLAGITYASGDCAGYFSGRNLDPCRIFEELIRHWEANAKVVLGKWADPYVRSSRSRPEFSSDTFIRGKLSPNRIAFQDISSLLIDREVFYVLSQITAPFSEIIDTLAWSGYSFHLVEYSFQAQEGGRKRLTFKDQSITLEYSEGLYSPKLFQTSLSVGLFLAMLGGLITVGSIIAGEYSRGFVPGWWMLSGVIVFIIGVQLGLMGVFGEHLFRSLEKLHGRPAFIVDSIVNPPVSSSMEGREKIEKMILSLWSIRKQKIAYTSSISALPSEDETEE